MRKIIFIILLFLTLLSTKAQEKRELYESVFIELQEMIEGKRKADFKKAVFSVENAYFDNEFSYESFYTTIDYYASICQQIIKTRDLQYTEKDKQKVSVYAAVFTIMKDTIPIQMPNGEIINNLPLSYDFDDIFGNENWQKMFVTKLIATKKGNCHSLPYFYKILVEELGEKAYLSFAPNHIYIKQQCKSLGWYNTELTSGMFPIDSWLMASGYIHLSAIQQGIYMDTLSTKQSIGTCVIDLAQGYKKKFGLNYGDFVLKSCDLVLEHFPKNINALLLKAETKMDLWKADTLQSKEQKQTEFIKIQELYSQIHELGYRTMPKEMYLDWLVSLRKEKQKYENKKVNFNIR